MPLHQVVSIYIQCFCFLDMEGTPVTVGLFAVLFPGSFKTKSTWEALCKSLSNFAEQVPLQSFSVGPREIRACPVLPVSASAVKTHLLLFSRMGDLQANSRVKNQEIQSLRLPKWISVLTSKVSKQTLLIKAWDRPKIGAAIHGLTPSRWRTLSPYE